METTDYLTEPELAQVVAGTMFRDKKGNPDVPLKLATALKTFQAMSEHIFYSVEEEAGGYIVKDRIGPEKKFPTFKSAVEFAQRSGLPNGSVKSVWNWRRDPKRFTQDKRMRNLRQVLQERIQLILDEHKIAITVIHIDHDPDNMSPIFRLNVNTDR